MPSVACTPSQPARRASSCSLSLRAWKSPYSSTRSKMRSQSARNSRARYSRRCQGLSDLSAPGWREREHVRGRDVDRPSAICLKWASTFSGLLDVLDRLEEHHGVARLDVGLDQVAHEAHARPGVLGACVLERVRVGVHAGHAAGPAGQHAGAVALAAGHVHHVQAGAARGDPLVHGQVAAEPVVLGGHVRAACARRSARAAAPRRAGAAGRSPASACQSRYYPAPAMPAPADTIREANVRYHDLAAEHYDSKWGIGYDDGRPGAGVRQAAQGARARRAARRRLRARARDRGGHRLLHAQPDARRGDSLGSGLRHLAGDAAGAVGFRRRPGAGGGDRRLRGGVAALRGRVASTSSSATPCCITCPTWPAPSASSGACCARAAWSPSAASRRATATASRRCRSAARWRWRRCGARCSGPARATATAERRRRGGPARAGRGRARVHAGRAVGPRQRGRASWTCA